MTCNEVRRHHSRLFKSAEDMVRSRHLRVGRIVVAELVAPGV